MDLTDHRADEPRHHFDPTLVRNVLIHMNCRHRLENLQLARLVDERLEPTRAWMAGLDSHGVDLVAEFDNGPAVLRVDFGWPASTLVRASEELAQLYRFATALPVPARTARTARIQRVRNDG